MDFLGVHLFCVILLIFLEILYFAFSQILNDVHKYLFRIRVLLPALYTAYFFVFFTGFLLEALKQFNDFRFAMFFGLSLALIISLYQFIKFKKYRKIKDYQGFKKLSLKLEALKLIILFGLNYEILF